MDDAAELKHVTITELRVQKPNEAYYTIIPRASGAFFGDYPTGSQFSVIAHSNNRSKQY